MEWWANFVGILNKEIALVSARESAGTYSHFLVYYKADKGVLMLSEDSFWTNLHFFPVSVLS